MVIRIGFVCRNDSKSLEMVKKLIEHLGSQVETFVEPDLASHLGLKGTPIEKMEVDFIVSVGGDGTILRTINKMMNPKPILGINMGTLGFLVDVEPDDAVGTLEHLLYGFEVDERTRLRISINGRKQPSATNEVVIITASPAKMLDLKITVEGSLLERIRADGMIFATSTGSTAYAMSAGGPIVDPRLDAIVLVPIAPFKLSARPWVLPAKCELQVELKLPGKEALVVVDGQSTTTVSEREVITIGRAETPARFVRASKDGFYQKVKSKLA
jgi:NAD+ kinase